MRRRRRAAAAYGEMGRLFMATEFLDHGRALFRQRAAARAERDALALLPRRTSTRMKNDPAKAAALFERALRCSPITSRASSGSARCASSKVSPMRRNRRSRRRLRCSRARPPPSIALGRVELATARLRARPRAISKPRSRCGRRRRASTIRWRSPIAVSATRATPKRRCGCVATSTSPPADPLMQQVGRPPAERRGGRGPRRRGPGKTPVGRSRHVSPPGASRLAPGQRVHAAQPRHGAVRDRRRRRRARAVSDRRPAVTRSRQGALRHRHRHGSGRPRPRSDRGVLGGRRQRPGLRRSAHEPRRCAAPKRTDGGIAAALRRGHQRAVRPSHRRASATPWRSCGCGGFRKRAIAWPTA